MGVPLLPPRARGNAALVLTRSDPIPDGGDRDAEQAFPDERQRWPRWLAAVATVALSAAVAWTWGLLLFGGSLRQ